MSEQDPLLPSSSNYDTHDAIEAQDHSSKSTYRHCQIRAAEFLESRPLHYTVITLVRTIFRLTYISCNSHLLVRSSSTRRVYSPISATPSSPTTAHPSKDLTPRFGSTSSPTSLSSSPRFSLSKYPSQYGHWAPVTIIPPGLSPTPCYTCLMRSSSSPPSSSRLSSVVANESSLRSSSFFDCGA